MHFLLAIFTISIFLVSTIADESGIKIDYLVTKKECEKRTKSGDYISMYDNYIYIKLILCFWVIIGTAVTGLNYVNKMCKI
jgi:hypothetical protein